MSDINKDLEFLQDNLQTMEEIWDLPEPPMGGSRLKYPFWICKKIVRKIIRWIMRPYFECQIEFNGAVTRAIGDIYRLQSCMLTAWGEEDAIQQDILPESDRPRIIQIVSSLNFGDAVGNDVIAIKNALQANGIVTEIYTLSIHKKIPKGTAKHIRRLPVLKKNDIVIYHFASADPLAETIKQLDCVKILRYHNITPPQFFKKYDSESEKNVSVGLKQVRELKDYINYVMTVSDFNKRDLQEMGYQCPMYVVPILIQFEDYAQEPTTEIVEKYSDDIKNIVFVGRIAPNKKIEDIISVFEYYHKNIDTNTRLIIVGAYNEKNKYYEFLQKLVKKLSINNIIFTGHIAFRDILAYYRTADVFLCMSEHEGFCVPLAEAMYFKVPIVAYASTAIPGTLNGCGVLVDSKEPATVAESLKEVLENPEYKQKILEGEERRLSDFDNEVVKKQLFAVLDQIMQQSTVI